MIRSMNAALTYCYCKIDAAFRRVFKEESGAAELVATLVIVGIALALAIAFRKTLIGMVTQIWDSFVKNPDTNPNTTPSIPEFGQTGS